MKRNFTDRVSFGISLGLSAENAKTLARLSTPEKIQDFLIDLPINHERKGDTCLSVSEVLRHNHAHCIEAGFTAAAALSMGGAAPLLMDMRAVDDDSDHVVALYRSHGCWGAISKSNHVWLRWRDPVYKSLRELAMSYFHEYVKDKRKTLRAYSAAFDLSRFENRAWVTNKESCWEIAGALDNTRHYNLLTHAQVRALKPRDVIEVKAGKLVEYRA